MSDNAGHAILVVGVLAELDRIGLTKDHALRVLASALGSLVAMKVLEPQADQPVTIEALTDEAADMIRFVAHGFIDRRQEMERAAAT